MFNMRFINIKVLIISVVVLFSVNFGVSQKTAIYDQPGAYYQSALALFNKEQFGPSQNLFQKSIDLINDPYSILRINAEYYKALCAVELFSDDAELLLLQFTENHPESMYIKHVYFNLGVFQYRKKGYHRALNSFDKVDVYDLTKEEQIEFYFKRGYSFFEEDSISYAKKNLFEVINKESKYQAPAMYYYSHIAYLEGNYETALKGFLSLRENESFKPVIPYYVTHIYYLQKKYDELLEVAPGLLENSTPKRQPEIARLIGEAYYRTGKYELSIPYLERYNNSSAQAVSATSQYQMAYAYYQVGNFEKAIPHFVAVSQDTNEMAQSANYHLAICYVNQDKKNYALNAFKEAYQIDVDPNITADALYNFAKLSYELDYNPYNQAVKAFEKYVVEYPNSIHRKEAMTYLTKMYLSTNNFSQALESIDKIQDKSPELLLAYQRILYSRGVQLFNINNYQEAIVFFDRSLKVNKDKAFTAKSLFWKAESYYRLKDYKTAITSYNSFVLAQGAFTEPNYNEAHYNLGYCYFQLNNYAKANQEFRIFMLSNKDSVSVMANDAYNRIADSYFIQSEYDLAVKNYDKAIAIGKRDVDYSLYKKAESWGPLNNYEMKASTFAQLIRDYPNSTYAGNAEYALAETYFRVLNNFDKAIEHYLHIIKVYPTQTNFVKKSKLDLGYLYANSKRTQEAIAVLKKVQEDYKGSTESKDALKALQDIYTEQGNVDVFFVWAEKQGVSVELSAQDSANYFIAENYYMSNNCAEAITAFRHYIERFPKGYFTNNAHYYKAECERKTQKYAEALQDYSFIVDRAVSEYTEKSIWQMSYINYDLFKDYPAARIDFVKLIKFSESKENRYKAIVGIMRCDWFTKNYDSVLVSSQRVQSLENIDKKIAIEAQMYQARVYMLNNRHDDAHRAFTRISAATSTIESAEAQYNLALIAFKKEQYDSAEAIAYGVIQQDPSYEYWVVKAFVLSADIFIKTDNLHQAKATLTSIVDNYKGDQLLLQEAKDKLALVNQLSVKKTIKEDSPEMIIDLGNDNKLFIDNGNEGDPDIENEFEEENVQSF